MRTCFSGGNIFCVLLQVDDLFHTVRGRVSSAVPLTETQLTALAARMGETLGKHVLLEGTVSPSLIGGIRVEIDGRVWDGSLRGRLEELSGLLRGAVL